MHKPDLLAEVTRGSTIDSLHYGWVCALNSNKKIIYKKGNINDQVFLRSIAKPIQAIPVIESGIISSLQELAIVCASHNGGIAHLKILNTLLNKHKIKLEELQCGKHMPIDEIEKERLIKTNNKPLMLHNNCSGKHIGILALCKAKNWDIKSYLKPNHILQKIIFKEISSLSETKNISLGIDGCSLPTFAISVINTAILFSNFTNSRNKTYQKIIHAMTNYPYLVGGKGQIDSELMKTTNGRILTKVGGGGIIVAATKGNSVVVKIADPSQTIRSFILLSILKKLDMLTKKELENSYIKDILSGRVKNLRGLTVGYTKTN